MTQSSMASKKMGQPTTLPSTKLLHQAREINCKFNPEKLVVRASKIPFFGHVISKDIVKPDPKKVKAIVHMQPPADKKQLANFLGLVNNLNKFSLTL